jgi:hypothetical protein
MTAKKERPREKTEEPGRPTELTPELSERILRRIEKDGTPPDLAARLEGVDSPTFKEWFAQGDLEGVGLHADLVRAIRKAVGKHVRRNLEQVMMAAANGKTGACDWLLGKTHTSIHQRIDPVKGLVVKAVSVPNRVRDPELIGRLLQVLLRTGEFDKYIEELGWRRTTDVSIVDSKQPER